MSTSAASGTLPCTGGCGCWTDHLVDDGSGNKIALCIFCEDGVPCPASQSRPAFNSAFVDARMAEHRGETHTPKKAKRSKEDGAGSRANTRKKANTSSEVPPSGEPSGRSRRDGLLTAPSPVSRTIAKRRNAKVGTESDTMPTGKKLCPCGSGALIPNRATSCSRCEPSGDSQVPREKKPCRHCGAPTASKVGYCGKHFYMSKLVNGPPKAEPSKHDVAKRPAKKSNGHAAAAANGNGHISVSLSADAIQKYLDGIDVADYVRTLSPQGKARVFEILMEG